MEKESSSTIGVNSLVSYEKGVIMAFKHCSESNLIYGEFIINIKQLLTELFKTTSELQKLILNYLEKIEFNVTLKEDVSLLLKFLHHIWYAGEVVYTASNKIMATNWKVYITISQKYSAELKENIINDEPIQFLCTELKKIVSSFNYSDEASLKLSTYMMSVLVKLCSHGHILKSHNILVEFILFLNSFWLSNTQDSVIIKDRLLQYVDNLVLISDEKFVKVFLSSCQKLINNNSSSQKLSALYIAMLLLKHLSKTSWNQLAYAIIYTIFQLIRYTDSVICCDNGDLYENLLIHLASVILVSEYILFEKVEKILIQNILNTEYWPAIFSSDLWIIIMRHLTPDLCNLQFSKLARLYEALNDFSCFTQCPQCIYLEMLLRRHFALITNKNQLVNICPQLKIQSLKSAIGILDVPTLLKNNHLSELLKIINILPEQTNMDHLTEDIIHLWTCVKDEYPPNFLCALVEISIGSKTLLKAAIPKTTKMLSVRTHEDTTEIKRCRLKLIRSILLYMPTFQEHLTLEILLEYLFDNHPLIQQWTVETIVYISSVCKNKNNLMNMLFKKPEVTTIITDYLEMKIKPVYNYNDFIQYFEQLSRNGKFQHVCSFRRTLDKMLDKLKTDVDCLNNIVSKTQMSVGELERLQECSTLLSNICKARQLN
ncbi:Hypothetical protein CINCED_3A023342 [Cinara cedri]|nr:Hypothetical protein CINCED_3A023342 [Cinara cedri]